MVFSGYIVKDRHWGAILRFDWEWLLVASWMSKDRLWRGYEGGGSDTQNVNCLWKSWGDEWMGWQVIRKMQLWCPLLLTSTNVLFHFLTQCFTFWPPFWELNLKLNLADLFSIYQKRLLILERKVINVLGFFNYRMPEIFIPSPAETVESQKCMGFSFEMKIFP